MPAPQEVVKLVERFQRNLKDYQSGKYNETQVRIEFIDPFFEAMGWDVHNKNGYAEPYKDVVHEDQVKVSGATKAPDYGFRIGGTRKFFVEAKKPSISIKEDIHPAYQLRRYAWSAKLPLSILTDFEEMAVYDCRIRPVKTDKSSTARVMYFTFADYVEKWDEIAEIFSREAVLQGSFDHYAESSKRKRGTAEVDTAFLEEIERWRETLARNIALRNPGLTVRDLNFAVQRTIDRIIFLRIAEDRGLEHYGLLRNLESQKDTYSQLCRQFLEADNRYNSGLFHFKEEKERQGIPDKLTTNLNIDDRVLKDILHNLYYPDSPYEFSVLPAEILGQVYEQFLGKVIRLTAGGQAKVEDKPEVKKAGGVYYTPTYIVDYIVEHTVGKLLEGKSPKEASQLKICDPACGSGSFLLGAYQYLLDWHRDFYVGENPEKFTKAARGRIQSLYQGPHGEWCLTTAEKRRILLNNIFGVDIDPQAVEVTKLSLLLKVLEGENEESLAQQLAFFQERALPDLNTNIKCGNSLIGPEFYTQLGQQLPIFDNEEIYRINAFDWHTEFSQIMENGGFDTIIGNPPYLRIQGLQEFYANQIKFFSRNYQSAIKRFDLYLLFLEKGYNLLGKNGKLGFICPHKFINSDFGSGLRKFLIDNSALKQVISFGNNLIFKQASTYTGIFILEKNGSKNFSYFEFPDTPVDELALKLNQLNNDSFATHEIEKLSTSPWVLSSKEIRIVLDKLNEQSATLGMVFEDILVGVQSGIDNVHVLKIIDDTQIETVQLFSERANENIHIERGLLKPLLRGEDIKRFQEPKFTFYCIYPYKLDNGKTIILDEKELQEKYPLGYSYLCRFRKELTEIRIRQKTNSKYWYSCHRSRNMAVFEGEKILTPEISLGCNMTLDGGGIYHNTKVYSLIPSNQQLENKLYWLGILNSKVLWWFISNTGYVLRGGYYVFKKNYLSPFPIPTIDFTNPTHVVQHDNMVVLVMDILRLHKSLTETINPREKNMLQRRIVTIENLIDTLVYELYGLTEEEIKIVEESRNS